MVLKQSKLWLSQQKAYLRKVEKLRSAEAMLTGMVVSRTRICLIVGNNTG